MDRWLLSYPASLAPRLLPLPMKLPPEGARWLVSLRWLACAAVFAATWLTSSVLPILADPLPLYLVACALAGYNLLFYIAQRDMSAGEGNVDRNIFLQVTFDLIALTLLLYFAGLPRNPFLFYFVFHMIIAGMYLRGSAPYFFAALSTTMVGAVMLLLYLQWIPSYPLRFPSDPPELPPPDGLYLLGVFVAFASALWMVVYFTTSIRRYVDRAHAEVRQKEKMLGIGQLVAGIAHQIANPLDGVQNCLQRIGERVKDDPHLTEYVQLMAEALERIERTAKRVQAFARPRGITLQSTDVNQAVEATLEVLGGSHGHNIRIQKELGNVVPVQGDPYTLQEVLFNLCTNALNAMPKGGTLALRTYALGNKDEDQMGSVAIDVRDTGVGIPRVNLEKIFEPFFTTRADSGGTGLGLGLCRMLISEMGGRIEVRSELGQGTTFMVVLNRADAKKNFAKG
jgi:signal transduction histidine kinase